MVGRQKLAHYQMVKASYWLWLAVGGCGEVKVLPMSRKRKRKRGIVTNGCFLSVMLVCVCFSVFFL